MKIVPQPRAPRELRLVPVGGVDPTLLGWLGGELECCLGIPARLGPALPLRDEWRGGRDGRFCSNRIMDALVDEADDCADPDGPWTLAVTETDLFAPGREWVFGEAAVGGRHALISTARLHPRPEESGTMLRTRALIEAVHELGHVAGLMHCNVPRCVMFESYGLAETDAKGSEFCPVCAGLLRGVIPPRRP